MTKLGTQHVVLYEGGDQALRHTPVDAQARPLVIVGGATYRVLDLRFSASDADQEIVPSTAAPQEATAATTTAAVGRGAGDKYYIGVDSVAGFVKGRRYILTLDGLTELFELAEVDSAGLRLRAKDRIAGSFAIGATVRGIEIVGTFPTAEAADESKLQGGGGPYAIDWSYEGRTIREVVWVRRQSLPFIVTRDLLTDFDPALENQFGKHITAEKVIRAATRSWVTDMTSAGIDPTCYSTPAAQEAVARLACSIAWYAIPDNDVAAAAGQRHQERYAHIVNNLKSGIDAPKTVTTTVDDGRAPRQRRGRFVRT